MNKNNKKKKPSAFFHNIFYNNRYLAVFSFVAALIVWIVVVMAFSPETTYKIEDVPVIINTENTTAEKLDLQPFIEKDYTVDVSVTGKRYSVTQRDISADDITVTANLNYVDSVGTHVLRLIPTKNNQYADYEITDLSSDEIEVYFDAYKEIKIDLKTEEIPENLVSEKYFVDGPVLSANSITVCGAATQINKIDRENIYARISEDELDDIRSLKETTYFNAVIDIVDNYGNKVNYVEIKDESPVIITVPVMQKAEFETSVEFVNTPENYNDFIESITITPETLNIGAVNDVIASMKSVIVGTIDFSNVKAGKNVFKFKQEDFSTNLKIFDEFTEATVTVNVMEAATKKVDIKTEQISLANIPDNYTISFVASNSTIKGVTIYGPEADLEALTADLVDAVVDFTGYEGTPGRDIVTARIRVKNQNCWAYGTYKIPVNVTVK